MSALLDSHALQAIGVCAGVAGFVLICVGLAILRLVAAPD